MADRTEQTELRTEMPTPLRLAEARERGFVPRSGELVAAVVLVAGLAGGAALGGRLLGALRRLMSAMLAEAGDASAPWSGQVASAGWAVAGWSSAILLIVLAAAWAGNVVQFGLLFAGRAASFDWGRLSPAAGLSRTVSRRSAVRMGLSVLKVLAVAGVVFLALRWSLSPASGPPASTEAIPAWMGWRILSASLGVAAALVAVGMLDLIYQQWQYRQDLKMSRRELLEDLRKTEGDSRIQRQREQLHAGLAGRSTRKRDGDERTTS